MRNALLLLSWCGLVLTVLPALLYFSGVSDTGTMKGLLLVGTGLWFCARIPLPEKRDRDEDAL